METRSRVFDTFQIVGFVVSTAVTLALVVARVDAMQCALLGLMLAILTQLFDLQLRHSNSEDRLLQVNALSQSLYRDPALLSKIRQMVEDYYAVRSGWFDLFKLRADEVVSECHSILRSMAGGTMEPPPRSQYSLSTTRFAIANTSLKQVIDWIGIRDAAEGMRSWHLKSMGEVRPRGIEMSSIVILSRKDLKEIVAQSQQIAHYTEGNYLIAFSDELPPELDENYMIVDDRVVAFFERRADGTFGRETISVIPVQVERMVKRFDVVMRYARSMQDVVAEMGQVIADPSVAL